MQLGAVLVLLTDNPKTVYITLNPNAVPVLLTDNPKTISTTLNID